MLAKFPSINYFGKQEAFKGQDKAYDNMHFADDDVLSDSITLTFAKLSLIAGKNFVQCGHV